MLMAVAARHPQSTMSSMVFLRHGEHPPGCARPWLGVLLGRGEKEPFAAGICRFVGAPKGYKLNQPALVKTKRLRPSFGQYGSNRGQIIVPTTKRSQQRQGRPLNRSGFKERDF